MELFKAIEKRRSVREFSSQLVPREDLKNIIAAARLAPSGYNSQPWKFIVLDNKEDISWFKDHEKMSWLATAPALVIVIVDSSVTQYWLEDGSATITTLMLAATALGYGSCWVEGQVLPYEDEVRDRFAIPQDWKIMAVVPIGKTPKWPDEKEKRTLSDVMSFNTFQTK